MFNRHPPPLLGLRGLLKWSHTAEQEQKQEEAEYENVLRGERACGRVVDMNMSNNSMSCRMPQEIGSV